jgi:sodium-dependent dicarboxylate transporter 2/3/5
MDGHSTRELALPDPFAPPAAHDPKRDAPDYAAAEERFNRRRATVGLVLGPVLFAGLLALPLPGLPAAAHRLSAVLALVIVFWITEAVALPVTALLGPVLAIVLRVAPAREVLAPFADPIIFLFMGSFMLAEAMYVHGLDRRLAFKALSLRWVGRSPARLVVMFGAVATGLSMWLSNTATTAMLFPIALSIVAQVSPDAGRGGFAMALMLITAFGASVGGMATPVGTPPNLIGIALLERATGIHISFAGWMVIGVPLSLLVFGFMAAYFRLACLRGAPLLQGAGIAAGEVQRMGKLDRGGRNVLAAFGLTVVLWVAPGVIRLVAGGEGALARGLDASVPEAVAAMIGALLLFVLPVDWSARRFTLTWGQAAKIDWGIILLFGGGLSLGGLTFSTGLADAIGRGVLHLAPAHTTFALTLVFTALAILLTETASNTAAATMVVPVAIAVAQAAGASPVHPALGATLGASMAFMLPVSTPPNAIVYSSGKVPIAAMIRHGLTIDLFGLAAVVALVMALGDWVAGVPSLRTP